MRYALIAVLVLSIGGTAPATAAEQDPGPITNALALQIVEESQYVKPGEPILVTLEQFGLEEAVMGYQAFTAFDPGAIAFDSGYYMSVPYDYWIIDPITASGGNIDLAAGAVVLVVGDAELAELAFTAGMAECVTQIVFRPHDPPSIFTDDAGYEVTPTLLDSPDIYIDGTPPVITCPPDLLDQPNDPGVCEAVLDVGTATATDNLSGVDTIQGTRSDGLALSAAYPVGTTTITWTAVDKSGNQAECVQTVTVVDVEDPSVTAPEDLIVSNDAGFCYATSVSLGTPDVDDNCGIEAGFPTNDAPAQFAVGQTVVTWTVQDIHGNQATDTQLVTVLDSEDPTITCPPDITVYCPAGVTSKTVDPGTATAEDNCGVQSVVGTRSDGLPLADPYPIGTTVITWVATDIHSNTSECAQSITVLNKNQATIEVEFEGVSAGATRYIEFQFGGDGSGTNTYAATATVVFDTNPATVTVDIEPGGVNWTCVSAKDRQHTLRSQVSLQLSGDIYTASFTGADKLIGGDLTDDNLVDILDFGVFSGQCGDDYGGPFAPPAKDANINGDGVVWSEDFSYIKAHFLELGDDPCQGAAAVSEPAPRDSMIIWEMASYLGYNAALSADINHDRWVNSEDVELFIKKYLKPKRTR